MIQTIPPESLSKVLQRALMRGGLFADIFIERSSGTTIHCEDNKIEKVIAGTNQGAGIRIIHQFKTIYGYTNDLSEPALLDLAETLSHALRKENPRDLTIGLTQKKPPRIFPILEPPEGFGTDVKVKVVDRANHTARQMDPRIKQVRVIYRDRFREVTISNSEGLLCNDKRTEILFLVHVITSDGQVIQTGYEPIGGFQGLEIFSEDTPENVAERAARRALVMLEAQPSPAGPMTVVLSSEAGGTMIHEAIGHGLEADLAQEGLSVYSRRLGDQIASPLITVIDDATIPKKRGSFAVDDEGVEGSRTVLVEKGVLKSYLYDRLTAMKENTASTGNGRRESYRHKPIPRMTNTFINLGDSDPEAIIRATQKGLLVKKMGGGQVNTVNGDFVFEVNEGYIIEGGAIGPAVRGATLIGNGPRILQDIDMVGNDLGFGIGTCGKDGQGVPVSDAQPTLRIPEIIVGGQGGPRPL